MSMTDAQKLGFVHKMTHLALQHVQHFDSGGPVLGPGGGSGVSGVGPPSTVGTQNAVNPASQGLAGGLGSFLGTNNNFQASGAQIQQGTNAGQINQGYTQAQTGIQQSNNLLNTLNPGVAQGAQTQNTLTNQLQQEALGKGPNPAQAALNQNTGQNIAQQAALAASVRGAGSNPGLIAEQNAQQGAATQQNAVGAEATQAAQQQLNAQNQLQGLASTQITQGSNANQLANQSAQNEQSILQNANTAANNATVSQQENINSTNAAVAAANANSNSNLLAGIGSAINGIGGAIGSLAFGGKVPPHLQKIASIYHKQKMAEGGYTLNTIPVSTGSINAGAPLNLPSPGKSNLSTVGSSLGSSLGNAYNSVSNNGQEDDAQMAMDAKGGKIPGKAKVNHDSYKNDTVDIKVTPGEVVIDLNTLHGKGKLGQMARFVAREIERKKAGRKLS